MGTQSPIFGPCLLRPNGWMDQDATWYGGRPRPRPHYVRWGPIAPPDGGTAALCFRPMSIVAKRSPVSATAERLLTTGDLSSIDISFLLTFLRVRYFSQLEARRLLDNFMTRRSKFPQWFRNLDPGDPNIQDVYDRGYVRYLLCFKNRTDLHLPKNNSNLTRHRAHINKFRYEESSLSLHLCNQLLSCYFSLTVRIRCM